MGEWQPSSARGAAQFVDQVIESLPPGRTYYREPLPCFADDQLTRLCHWYMRSSPMERGAFSSSLQRGHGDLLLVFSERMATLAIRETSVSRLRCGIVAIGMLGLTTLDFRESLVVLALLHRSAVKLGVDPNALFLEGAEQGNPEVAEQLRMFAKRERVDIESMGFRETNSPDGFLYERSW